MAGVGDMLDASIQYEIPLLMYVGLKLTPLGLKCKEKISSSKVYIGDAFSLNHIPFLNKAWDLVITNPPYVRYQTIEIMKAEALY